MEKALPCVFVAMVRNSIPEYSANNRAAWFKSNNDKVINIINFILNRVKSIHPSSYHIAKEILDDPCSAWDYMSENYPDLCYVSDCSKSTPLLVSAENLVNFEFPPILNSLRNVEQSSNIYIEE